MSVRKIVCRASSFILLILFCNSAYSQTSPDFAGLKFGVGLSLTVDIGSDERIESAELVNNIVRVTNENNTLARIMLESHYFFLPDRSLLAGQIKEGNWGMGPFVALQPGSDEIVEAIGLGWMFGFKRDTPESEGPEKEVTSWNVGLGLIVDPNGITLGDGIIPNRALPSGEENIRFKENSQLGILIITSFGF